MSPKKEIVFEDSLSVKVDVCTQKMSAFHTIEIRKGETVEDFLKRVNKKTKTLTRQSKFKPF